MPDIEDYILRPRLLNSLQQDIPPVQCIVWKGGNTYERLVLDKIYPFDTINDIKRMICAHYYPDDKFHPKFLFVGIPSAGGNEEAEEERKGPEPRTTYLPVDYLWYANGSSKPEDVHHLQNPITNLQQPDKFFFTPDGSWTGPATETRGRATIEHVFLKPTDGEIPVLHVFPLAYLMQLRARPLQPSEIPEEDWNKYYAPYYKDVPIRGPYRATEEDKVFARKIKFYVEQRIRGLYRLDELLQEDISGILKEELNPKVEGVRQLRLIWKKAVEGFEGCGSMFYRIRVTEKRPYIRLLPADGSPITKLHVKGVLPIPTLEDTTLLESWAKEISPEPTADFCVVKYLQQSATLPIYGTIHVFNDGTINLLLQPPKGLKRLDSSDFYRVTDTLEEVMEGLPQDPTDFQLREIAVTLSFKKDMKDTRFTKEKIQQRLPYFQTFFQEIPSLPTESPILSLRYKAVSQFAAEDKYFTFLTQLDTKLSLQGEASVIGMIEGLETEFLLPRETATQIYTEWLTKRGQFSLEVPEEGEFMKLNNPGIDIHIYEQHPLYYFHINRVDSYETYRRIYTLLCLMFMEGEDNYEVKDVNRNEALVRVSEDIRREERKEEEASVRDAESAANRSLQDVMEPEEGADAIDDDLMDMLMRGEVPLQVGEVLPESAPSAMAAAPLAPAVPIPAAPAATMKKGVVDPNQWFLKKLKAMDSDLFVYKASTGSSGYSRKCSATDDRQPVVMTQNQYQRLRDIYQDTPHIHWIEYPLTGSEEPIQPAGTEITITVMKYGSSPKNIHYYFCPEYYCLLDELMILERDFEGTRDWYGHRKEPNTCPFCHGRLITGDQKAARSGYTVVRREKSKASGLIHGYIRFLSSTTHPKYLALPCCFTTPETLRLSDKRFAEIRRSLMDMSIQQMVERQEGEEEIDAAKKSMALLGQKEEEEDLVHRSEDAIEYAILFQQLHEKNFLEPNKTLKPKNVGAAPPQFDAYFHQDSFKNIVHRVKVYLTLQANAQGFIRVGTPNPVNESLLGVIAPLLERNTIGEVKRRLLEVMVPRVFLNSHFGNLVLEFYYPEDKEAMPPTYLELKTWSELNLGISISSKNTYQLIRIYNSYRRFIQFLKDENQRKDLRHIQPILAEPGLVTSRGLQLIVMEDHGDKPVTIKCPTFGVSMDRNRKNDFAFISRSIRTIAGTQQKYAHYELYVHTSNKPPKGGQGPIHETILKWNHQSRSYWPKVVETRIDEYLTQCQSRYRSLFTSQDGVSPMAMIPLSKAVEATSALKPYGIIKDSYNHVVGLTFQATKAPRSTPLVTLPVVDDGVISISSAFSIKHIHLDWEDYEAAPTEDIVAFYRDKLSPLFALYPGYTVQSKVIHSDQDRVVAIQLANGIFIPASPGKDSLNTVRVNQFQWGLDKEIAGIPSKLRPDPWVEVLEGLTTKQSCGFDSELVRKSSYVEFEELYQQFRLMVSNWLSEGGEVRKQVEKIIFHRDLPSYEKRKRMDILLSSTLQSWFYPDKKPWSAPVTFLRRDCRVIDSPTACSGTCVWKEGANGGKCLLHVDAMTPLRGREVSTPELFTKRVLDELVRFPARRKQLLTRGDISRVSKIMEPIRQGDEYIIPESSPTWTNLLRLEWTRQILEEPEYYEEMSSRDEYKEERKHEEEGLNEEVTPRGMPPELAAILGRGSPLRLHVPAISDEKQPLLPFMAILGVTFDRVGLGKRTDAPILTKDNLIKYVRTTTRPIGIVDLRTRDQGALFVKPEAFYGAVSILVYLPNQQVGILMDPNGEPSIELTNLPASLETAWKNALVVKRQLIRIQKENEQPPPLVAAAPKKKLLRIPKVNNEPEPEPIKPKRKLRIAKANEEPKAPSARPKTKLRIPKANDNELQQLFSAKPKPERSIPKENEKPELPLAVPQKPIQEEEEKMPETAKRKLRISKVNQEVEEPVPPPEAVKPKLRIPKADAEREPAPKTKLRIPKENQVPVVANRTLRRVRFANEEGKAITQPKPFYQNKPVSNIRRNQTKRKLRSNLFE